MCYNPTSIATEPYSTQTTNWINNNDTSANYAGNEMYVWFNAGPAASIGTALVKIDVESDSVEPSASTPATPQQDQIVFIINKTTTASSIERLYINKNSLQLFPNPVSGDNLNIKVDEKLKATAYKIYDIQGRVIKESQIKEVINISDLSSGTYNFAIFNELGVQLTSKQFIK
jgi:hypothetical protein